MPVRYAIHVPCVSHSEGCCIQAGGRRLWGSMQQGHMHTHISQCGSPTCSAEGGAPASQPCHVRSAGRTCTHTVATHERRMAAHLAGRPSRWHTRSPVTPSTVTVSEPQFKCSLGVRRWVSTSAATSARIIEWSIPSSAMKLAVCCRSPSRRRSPARCCERTQSDSVDPCAQGQLRSPLRRRAGTRYSPPQARAPA